MLWREMRDKEGPAAVSYLTAVLCSVVSAQAYSQAPSDESVAAWDTKPCLRLQSTTERQITDKRGSVPVDHVMAEEVKKDSMMRTCK